MFQRAGTRRTAELTGTSPRGVGTTKSVMPCRSGDTPVAMVVQMTGDLLHCVPSGVDTPRSASSRRCGSPPTPQRRSSTSRSPPSMPITTSFGRLGSAQRVQAVSHAPIESAAQRAASARLSRKGLAFISRRVRP
ncbi:MAG TPA: hypothetical protein VNB06_06055, partial [Thermoanaerobaculia bacterium]|nr:hypothetical protein [Thermoanaerobaculia bacterium]